MDMINRAARAFSRCIINDEIRLSFFVEGVLRYKDLIVS